MIFGGDTVTTQTIFGGVSDDQIFSGSSIDTLKVYGDLHAGQALEEFPTGLN